MMFAAALRDLQWRRRRFIIAIIGTSVLFAMTLVLTGLSAGFDTEAEETVANFAVDAWVVQEDAPGPFLAATPIAATVVDEVATTPGVTSASAFVFGRQTHGPRHAVEDVNVFGTEPAGPAMVVPDDGQAPRRPGEMVASTELGVGIGETFELGPIEFEVVGTLDHSTSVGGAPNVFVVTEDAQALIFNGAPAVSAVAVTGEPETSPTGTVVASQDDALGDLLRPLDQAGSSITFIAVLLWIVAVMIIGSVVYLSALERLRDFAIFKAVGVSTGAILTGLVLQAAILAVAAAIVGAALSTLLGPLFPMRVEIPLSAMLALPLIAIVIGAIASTAGVRRVLTVDPAMAFGGP